MTSEPVHDGRLWRWYAQTEVRLSLPGRPALTLRPAELGVTAAWPFAEEWAWVITACNPRSVPLGDLDNRARHSALGRELAGHGIPLVEAHGYDPGATEWTEPGYCVPGLPEVRALALARTWEQNAVFLWTPAMWSVVGVLLPGRTDLGWTLTEGP